MRPLIPAQRRLARRPPCLRPRYVVCAATTLLIAAVGPASGQARTPDDRSTTPTAEVEVDSLAVESGTSTVRWETLATGAVIWGSLAGFDQMMRDFSKSIQRTVGSDLSSIGREYGNWPVTGPVFLGGSLLVGALADGTEGLRRGLAATLGLVTGSLVNEAVNQAVGRRRPSEDLGSLAFDPFHGHSSFGSGHAAFAFAMAGSVDEVTKGWYAIPFYGAAGLTALSRVYDDRHWFSDIVLGSVIGYWVGRRATRMAASGFGVPTGAPTSPEGGLVGFLARLEPVATADLIGVRIRF